MKQARRSLYAVVLLFMLFMMQQLGLIDPILSGIESVPWWVYLLIAGILFSGYRAFSISREDKELDDEWVEKQGNIYMKRIEAEKERRDRNKDPKAML
ncbi:MULTISPECIES: sporulation YhaL family protein [unclassified Sporolactobacillus]|uniref:sporulation YhaL family protein n=1 Tax=unclassified Sporolactobacillus TaxID=2628533 RepID=UPI002368D246|nr:sporulation YhaL family protein [Sporolactobacillus sp. CQH2019]MDD9149430.1 sporulation YhaL family protein [Sporolactobacillus sp. CQH2019]